MPMLQRRALKHSCSSPHMSSGLKSSTFGPPGGMTFPKVLERNESGLSEVLRPTKSTMKPSFGSAITEEDSPIRTQMANRDDDPYRDNENNEDMKTPGYPDGPIAIYGDNVYLYSEPNADEAARFDPRSRYCHFDSQLRYCFRVSPEEESAETPTTPKATHFKEPEYIHIPWDHNTDIAPDLMRLCETIEDRTRAGLKVLVHCQQGASRSASLIIAYGLYQKPELTVNDAYYAAQSKSQWISPNMKLMYSLQDFQKEVSGKRSGPAAHGPRTGRVPTKHRLTLSADAIDISPKTPQTAPLPTHAEDVKETQFSPSPNRLRGNSTPGLLAVSPGPASAPPTCTWMEEVEQQTSEQLTPFKLGGLPQRPKSGHGRSPPTLAPPPTLALAPAPSLGSDMMPPPTPGFPSQSSFGFQSMTFPRFNSAPSIKSESTKYDDAPVTRTITLPGSFPDDEALLSPRVETMTNNPLHEVGEVAGMRFVECPPTPSQSLFFPSSGNVPSRPILDVRKPCSGGRPSEPPNKRRGTYYPVNRRSTMIELSQYGLGVLDPNPCWKNGRPTRS
ncbi:tyrosine/serine/threonine protein phosphatase [Fusarium falciforme]|nr:tyrosine/serine/threonine protein phosphatase [Fusarium falciforme]